MGSGKGGAPAAAERLPSTPCRLSSCAVPYPLFSLRQEPSPARAPDLLPLRRPRPRAPPSAAGPSSRSAPAPTARGATPLPCSAAIQRCPLRLPRPRPTTRSRSGHTRRGRSGAGGKVRDGAGCGGLGGAGGGASIARLLPGPPRRSGPPRLSRSRAALLATVGPFLRPRSRRRLLAPENEVSPSRALRAVFSCRGRNAGDDRQDVGADGDQR